VADLLVRLQAALAGRYTIERELGRGGMALVYLARDLKHDRPVALKVLRPEVALALGTDRFLREMEIAAHLTHPHILALHDSGQADDVVYYVMPYVEGESLRDRLNREKQLSLDDTLQVAREVADALSYAHGHNVVHRDVKPENILFEAGHAVVSDFGIARAIIAAGGAQLTETGIAVGTPAYMSPEQASAQGPIDGRADVYALGCVVYEMLAGAPPFTGPSAQAVLARHALDPVPPLRTVRKAVPPAVEQAVTKALEKVPADRFETVAQFAAALESGTTRPTPSRVGRRWRALAFGVALTGAAAGVLLWRSKSREALEPNLVAVAPFEVLDPKLAMWREGLVDVLSRSLDGAGPLRTVAPTVVVRRWQGRPDPTSATELGRRTGARLAVFGSLLGAGADTVRLAASVFDVAAQRALGELEVRDAGARMDRVADSAAVAILRELSRTRPIGAFRAAWLGSTPVPALKAFLQGDQFYRRAAWDSALAHYKRAVALDSTFALAWRRMSGVLGCWRRGGSGHPLATLYGLRAGAWNRGLPPRDSLLISADSLFQALYDGPHDPAWQEHNARLFATLRAAARRYPDDPEVWFELGDAMVHHPAVGRPMLEQALDAFDRAIALDASFGPAYIHPVELSLQLGRPAAAQRYLALYLGIDQADANSQGMGLVESLLSHPLWSADLQHRADTSSGYELFSALWVLRHVPDSAEAEVRLARAFLGSRRSGDIAFDDSLARRVALTVALGHRGHLRQAYAVGGARFPLQFAQLAALGGVPPDTVRTTFGRWVRQPFGDLASFDDMEARLTALPWWAGQRDTTALHAFVGRSDSLTNATRRNPELRLWAAYGVASGRAYLALAQADSADALQRFVALPDSVCPCLLDRITTARLLGARRRDAEASTLLTLVERSDTWDPAEGLWWAERGRVAERRGERQRAWQAYKFLTALWQNADPELQPYVAEAGAALKRLSR
jgi:serine/threonine-protein kinase